MVCLLWASRQWNWRECVSEWAMPSLALSMSSPKAMGAICIVSWFLRMSSLPNLQNIAAYRFTQDSLLMRCRCIQHCIGSCHLWYSWWCVDYSNYKHIYIYTHKYYSYSCHWLLFTKHLSRRLFTIRDDWWSCMWVSGIIIISLWTLALHSWLSYTCLMISSFPRFIRACLWRKVALALGSVFVLLHWVGRICVL